MLSDEEIEACAFVVATLRQKRCSEVLLLAIGQKIVTASVAAFD
jgi:hypothetical protein